jgi:hypothetical protein
VAAGLHAACPGTSDAKPAKVSDSIIPGSVYDSFNLCAQGECPAHTVDLLLFIELKQAFTSLWLNQPTFSI